MTLAYQIVLFLHSILRYVAVISALVAIVMAFRGWLTRRPFTALDDRLGMIYTTSLHTQLLVGLLLYAVFSPLTQVAFRDMGAAMATPALRFYSVEHISLMVVGIIVATAGRALARRAKDDAGKHRMAAILYTLSIVLIFVAIPWPWGSAAVARPLDPFHMFAGN